jgi:hypothetical protein
MAWLSIVCAKKQLDWFARLTVNSIAIAWINAILIMNYHADQTGRQATNVGFWVANSLGCVSLQDGDRDDDDYYYY